MSITCTTVVFLLAFVVQVRSHRHDEYTQFTDAYQNCSKLERFARSLNNFTYCSLKYTGEYYRLCSTCVGQYSALRTSYESLVEAEPVPLPVNSSCQEDIIDKDKLSSILSYFSETKRIWVSGNCDNCYDTMKGQDEQSMNQFVTMFNDLFDCMTEHANESCTLCKGNYTQLNDFYLQLTGHYGNNLCYEITDMMGYVRDTWTHNYNCVIDHSFDVLTLMLALLCLLLLPIVFYGLGRCFCHQSEPKLLQQKRLSSINLANERTRLVNPVGENFASNSYT